MLLDQVRLCVAWTSSNHLCYKVWDARLGSVIPMTATAVPFCYIRMERIQLQAVHLTRVPSLGNQMVDASIELLPCFCFQCSIYSHRYQQRLVYRLKSLCACCSLNWPVKTGGMTSSPSSTRHNINAASVSAAYVRALVLEHTILVSPKVNKDIQMWG